MNTPLSRYKTRTWGIYSLNSPGLNLEKGNKWEKLTLGLYFKLKIG